MGIYILVVYYMQQLQKYYLWVFLYYIGIYRYIWVFILLEVIYRYMGICIILGINYWWLIIDLWVFIVDVGCVDYVYDGFIVRVQLQGFYQGEYVIYVNVDFFVDCD